MPDLELSAGLEPDPDFAVSVARELCTRRSVSGEEAGIAAYVAEVFRRIGLDTVVQEVLPGRPNVLGILDTGRPGPTLLFNGHLDTLPIPPGYTHDPLDSFVRDGRLHGAEVNNMKGAVGAMIATMAALATARDRLGGKIVLSAVMAECDSLGHGTLAMLESGIEADFCINGEPTDLQVMTNHGGVTQLRISARGVSVHVCRKAEGRSALDELLPVLAALDESCLTAEPHPDFPGLPTINVGVVKGGIMPSMLVGEAEGFVDIRTVPGMTPGSVLRDIQNAAASVRTRRGTVPDVSIELLSRPGFCQQYPYQVDPAHPVVGAIREGHRVVTGREPYVGPLQPQVFFGTDASHISRTGIPTVIYGPGKVDEINVRDESMAVADLLTAARVYTAAAARLCERK
jgi:acetylornithine deacetylase/succinyl-diaminopimelate desuccinylase-like protein